MSPGFQEGGGGGRGDKRSLARRIGLIIYWTFLYAYAIVLPVALVCLYLAIWNYVGWPLPWDGALPFVSA